MKFFDKDEIVASMNYKQQFKSTIITRMLVVHIVLLCSLAATVVFSDAIYNMVSIEFNEDSAMSASEIEIELENELEFQDEYERTIASFLNKSQANSNQQYFYTTILCSNVDLSIQLPPPEYIG